MTETGLKELVRLLELDYEKSTKLIEGIVGTSFTIRGWGIALSSALIGFTFQTKRWQVAALAVVVTMLIALIDVYHSWLYAKVLTHAQNIEQVLGLYFASLSRGEDDPDAAQEFEVAILAHRFGRFAEIRRFGWKALLTIRPRMMLVILYGTLIICSIASGFLVTNLRSESPAKFECTAVGGAGNVYVCQPK